MSLAALLIFALLLDALFGEPAWLWSRLPHPAVLMGRLVGALDRRLNTGDSRGAAGALAVVILVVSGLGAGFLLSLAGPLAEVIIAAILLAQRSLVQHVSAVSAALRSSRDEGRAAVSMIVSRDTSAMDDSAIARSAIESAAENLSDGVIAPAFWFLIGGLPGIVTYKLINTADSMIGYRTEKYEAFGRAAARLDDLMNLIPARLTALLLALAGRVTDLHGVRADAGLHRSPNAGWPEAALSRALGIALSGPRTYDGRMQDFAFVNENGRRALSDVDIDAAIAMLWRAWGLFLALCFVFVILF
ncbi:adenosylcobinamide-phosphate synthase CbiB [Roseobacter ponti]|uniref:Cobalamin biosynthesis protein CobD n=1 Tax=Roseobacter ponti TaxID=1891787 RepID=A0A858SYR2_9RHOB|nr:adenosylcobinamide-phosphate synthase CbiB [Roseobacter ponti]QJF52631.1 cobalamin biosynthesis protein [Roseobacter ponti]